MTTDAVPRRRLRAADRQIADLGRGRLSRGRRTDQRRLSQRHPQLGRSSPRGVLAGVFSTSSSCRLRSGRPEPIRSPALARRSARPRRRATEPAERPHARGGSRPGRGCAGRGSHRLCHRHGRVDAGSRGSGQRWGGRRRPSRGRPPSPRSKRSRGQIEPKASTPAQATPSPATPGGRPGEHRPRGDDGGGRGEQRRRRGRRPPRR